MKVAGRLRSRRVVRRRETAPDDVEFTLGQMYRPRRGDWRFALFLLGDLLAPLSLSVDGAAAQAAAVEPDLKDGAPPAAENGGAANDDDPRSTIEPAHHTTGTPAEDGTVAAAPVASGDDYDEAAVIDAASIADPVDMPGITIDLPHLGGAVETVTETIDVDDPTDQTPVDQTPVDDGDDPVEEPVLTEEDPDGDDESGAAVVEDAAPSREDAVQAAAPIEDSGSVAEPEPETEEPPNVAIFIDQDIDSASGVSMALDIEGDYVQTISTAATPTYTSYDVVYIAPEGSDGWNGWTQINVTVRIIEWDTFTQQVAVDVEDAADALTSTAETASAPAVDPAVDPVADIAAAPVAVEDAGTGDDMPLFDGMAEEMAEQARQDTAVLVDQAVVIDQKAYLAVTASGDGTILNIGADAIIYNEISQWTTVDVLLGNTETVITTINQTVDYTQDTVIDVAIDNAPGLDIDAIFEQLGSVLQTVEVVIELVDGEPVVRVTADQAVILNEVLTLILEADDVPLVLTSAPMDDDGDDPGGDDVVAARTDEEDPAADDAVEEPVTEVIALAEEEDTPEDDDDGDDEEVAWQPIAADDVDDDGTSDDADAADSDPERVAEAAADAAEEEDLNGLRDDLEMAFDSGEMLAFDSFFEAWADAAEATAEEEEARSSSQTAANVQDNDLDEVEMDDPDDDDDDDPYSAS